MPTDENIMKRFSETLGTYVLPSVYGDLVLFSDGKE